MKIRGKYGWWLENNSFAASKKYAAEISTLEQAKNIIRNLLEIPSESPRNLVIELDDGKEIKGSSLFRKVERWELLRELKTINLGNKGKNLKAAKEALDRGESICVNGCQIWNDGAYYCWEHYGSSACRRTFNELRFIFSKIARSDDYSYSIIPDNLRLFEIRPAA